MESSAASPQVEAPPTPAETPEAEMHPLPATLASSSSSNVAVMRKSSFLTARPFDLHRAVAHLPIKRPNFAPAVILPVPAVARRFHQSGRAPEVRGFASLPPGGDDPLASSNGRSRSTSPTAPLVADKPTTLIRNQLIQSARRPSGDHSATTNGHLVSSAHFLMTSFSFENKFNSIPYIKFIQLIQFNS